MNTEDLTKSLFEIIDTLNAQLPENRRVEKCSETALIGRNASLDSLGLIMFLTQIETTFAQKHKLAIELPYEKVVQRDSPFQNIATLAQHISDNMSQLLSD
jgi:acyl carrier protein